MYLLVGLVLVVCLAVSKTEKCITPNNEEGECISLYSCTKLTDALANKQDSSIELIKNSNCGGTAVNPMVCCASRSSTPKPVILKDIIKNLIPNKSYCGFQHSDDYFRNDTSIAIHEFPWQAALIYISRFDNASKYSLKCSGSLITNRYVLTTAHCVINPEFKLVGVRLGEYNIKNDTDCTEEYNIEECSEPPQEFDVEKTIYHPYYSRLTANHDIALVRLNQTVTYSDYIRPICLPLAGSKLAQPGDILFTSGWGATATDIQAEVKKKVSSEFISNEECAKLLHRYISDNQFCIKELEENAEFSCQGDSGGPIIFSFRTHQWHQEGIFGTGVGCGLGTKYTVVQTKVVSHLKWIVRNIEP